MDGTIVFRFGVWKLSGGGWVPVATENGRRLFHRWRGEATYSRANALALARARVTEESERYIGDWTITIEEVS